MKWNQFKVVTSMWILNWLLQAQLKPMMTSLWPESCIMKLLLSIQKLVKMNTQKLLSLQNIIWPIFMRRKFYNKKIASDVNNTVFSRPRECRIHSDNNELFPLHSFDNGLCLDDRLGVELLEISHSVRFKYKTFRFRNLKTINQRSRINWFLRRIDFWQNRGVPAGEYQLFGPWIPDPRIECSST